MSLKQRIQDAIYNIKHPYNELEENRYKILAANNLNSIATTLVGGNFFTGLLIYLNANSFEIGIISIITYVCNILQILSPLLLSRFEKRKKLLIAARILSHSINIVTVGIISILPMQDKSQIYLILSCTAILNITSAFTAQGLSLWHYQSIPEHKRAVHFSQNSIIGTIVGNIIVLTAGAVLDWFKAGDAELLGLTVLRLAAIIVAVFDVICLSKIKEYPYGETVGNVSIKRIFTEPLKHKKYLKSILIIFLWNFLGGANGGYYTVYMLDVLEVSYSFLNLFAMITIPLTIIVNPLWAKYINRTSWLSTLYKGAIAYGIFHVGYAFVTKDMLWFYIVPVITICVSGPAISNAISNLAFYNLPRESQSVCLPFCSTFTYLGALLGSGHALLFMTLFENLKITLFGMVLTSYQIIMILTGIYIFLYGIIVYFFHKREEREKANLPAEA